ncbi:TNF receptor-associated factor 4-like isoform X2 [Lineus longissimus]|uniref:TNF receptor-associated factor 4-like isoform X2 n=1 Tax=Lineus longissimus TaxID=88925 RepID=UPI002B4EC990
MPGYTEKFADPIRRKFFCPICRLPMKDAVQLTTCGDRFCDTCLQEYLSEGVFQCPEDNTPLDYAKIYPDKELQEEIQASMVRCHYHIEGCKWTDRLSNLKAHLEVCAYNPIPCPNDCSTLVARICIDDHLEFTCSHRRRLCDFCGQEFAGDMYDTHEGNCQYEVVWCENKCGAKLQRRFLGNHTKNECHKRLANCRYCQKEFLYETLQTHQYSCPRYPIPCPNRCEPVKIPREEIDSHINECCPSATISCMFKEYGCQHKCPRFNLERHLDDNTKGHLTMMCKHVRRQQQQINALRAKVNNLSQVTDGVFIWKVTDYKLKLAEARSKLGLEIMSEPFYTSRYGYKLIASAFLNGNGSGEGKYFSLYIKLLPGEYDTLLEWPFKLPVSFFLIDQTSKLDSRTDIMESFVPDPSWKHFQKPGKEDNSLGFGYPKFVPHETIRTRHYLKEDSLFVKIEVDTSRMCPL